MKEMEEVSKGRSTLHSFLQSHGSSSQTCTPTSPVKCPVEVGRSNYAEYLPESVNLEEFSFESLNTKLETVGQHISPTVDGHTSNSSTLKVTAGSQLCTLPSPNLYIPVVNSTSLPPLDESCDELEDRLLEGALKNLDYFPQLLKEVQRIKKEKDEQKRINEERKRVVELKAEERRLQIEKERGKVAQRQRDKAILDAKQLLADEESKGLQTEIDNKYAEVCHLHRANDQIESELYLHRRDLERLRGLEQRLQNTISSSAPPTTLNYSQLIGVKREELFTAKGQGEFLHLVKIKSEQDKQLHALKLKVQELTNQKASLIDSKSGEDESEESRPSIQKMEVQKRIDQLKENKARLVASLEQYK